MEILNASTEEISLIDCKFERAFETRHTDFLLK